MPKQDEPDAGVTSLCDKDFNAAIIEKCFKIHLQILLK